MAEKYLVFIASCFMLAFTQVYGLEVHAVDGKVKITVGTTAGCRDTVNFISNQLVETHRLYGDFLEIEFVPWGRTQLDSNGTPWCQFGVADCWANRLHRCVLDVLKDNQDAQVNYMACEFSSPFPSFLQGSYQCVEAAGVDLTYVDHCVTHAGDDLDKEAQAAAAWPMEIINFVPHIVFNDIVDVSLHFEALVRLTSMICIALTEDPSTGVTNC